VVIVGDQPTAPIGGSARVLSDMLHHLAWCRTSTWPVPSVDPCNGLASGIAVGRGCRRYSGTNGRPKLARSHLT